MKFCKTSITVDCQNLSVMWNGSLESGSSADEYFCGFNGFQKKQKRSFCRFKRGHFNLEILAQCEPNSSAKEAAELDLPEIEIPSYQGSFRPKPMPKRKPLSKKAKRDFEVTTFIRFRHLSKVSVSILGDLSTKTRLRTGFLFLSSKS